MRFELEEIIVGSVDRVYTTIRDRLSDLVPYLPAVDEITELERDGKSNGSTRIVLEWIGNSQLLPSLAKPFWKPAMTTWTDYAVWTDGDPPRTEWRFEPKRFRRLFTCEGTNRFEAVDADRTAFRLSGDLHVYPERIPGIPKFLARKLKPSITGFVIKRIKPNLMQVPEALTAFFAEDSTETGGGDHE